MGTSHVPSIAAALDKGLRDSAEWALLRRLHPRAGLDRGAKPDIAVVIFNDHGNAFFLDRVPTLALGVAENTTPSTKAGARARCPLSGAPILRGIWPIAMVEGHFDPLICRELTSTTGFRCRWN
jgi:protocatechuate 4,5-dioxygenase, beta chain